MPSDFTFKSDLHDENFKDRLKAMLERCCDGKVKNSLFIKAETGLLGRCKITIERNSNSYPLIVIKTGLSKTVTVEVRDFLWIYDSVIFNDEELHNLVKNAVVFIQNKDNVDKKKELNQIIKNLID